MQRADREDGTRANADSKIFGAASLVSLVVPVFNHSRFVVECLESIRQSGQPNLEIVAIDDASRDDSVDVLGRWCDAHPEISVKRVVHEKNLGVSKTLNEGVRLAAGEFICPLASDDALLPGGLPLRIDFLERHPDKLAVFADSEVIDEQGNLLHRSGIEGFYRITGMRKKFLVHDELIAPSVFLQWGVPGPGILLRAEAFRQMGGYDETLGAEDWDFYNRLALAGKLGFIDAVVARYRVHGQNAIVQQRIATMGDAVRVAERYSSRFGYVGRLRLAVLKTQHRSRMLGGARRLLLRVLSALLFLGSLFVVRVNMRYRWLKARGSSRRLPLAGP